MSSDLLNACKDFRVEEAMRLLATANSADVKYCGDVNYELNNLRLRYVVRLDEMLFIRTV